MNRELKTVIVLVGAFVAAVAIAVTPSAAHDDDDRPGARPPAPAGTRCFDVRAEISVLFTADGCDSPVGMCTAGTVRSRGAGGIVAGTTRFRALGLGGGVVGEPSIVFPPAEPASTWSYRGDLAITTALGVLNLEDVGVFDTVRGSFSEMNRVVGGTGIFRDAQGDLFMYGYSNASGTGFDGDIRGRVCVPTRWRH